MKNQKKYPWKNHLPEHLPNETLWENMSAKKSLDGQISDLKSQLPLAYPKEDLWRNIEKSLNKRRTFVLLSRIISVAAVLLFGLWGATALFNTSEPKDTLYLTTEISQDFEQSTPEIQPILILKTEEDIRLETRNENQTLQIKPIEKIEILEIENAEPFQVEIPLPEIFFAEVDRRNEESDGLPDTTYKGKKTIAISWDEQPIRIKIEGFHIELTEKEIQLLKELENRKKGKFNVHINALTARLYEK